MSSPRQVPYHRAWISEAEIEEVVATLRSGWLTTGPRTKAFEQRFSKLKMDLPSVAVSSCTAGLFLAMRSLDLQQGDEVITTPMSFVATSHVILQNGGKVVFADIDRQTMNIDPQEIERKIGPKTRAILPVHVGGNPCDMAAIVELAQGYNLKIVEDCAHAIEGSFQGKPLGTFGHAASFSFYPTKNITTGEGGMVLCQDEELALRIRRLSSHGIAKSTWQRMEVEHNPLYDVLDLGFKYNMSDLQAALGLPQLDRLDEMFARRQWLRRRYDMHFEGLEAVQVIRLHPEGQSALHLYLMLLDPERLKISRGAFIAEAREMGIELSVNYTPIHLFTWYQQNLGTKLGDYPQAEYCGANVISLPFYPAMTDADADWVCEGLGELIKRNLR